MPASMLLTVLCKWHRYGLFLGKGTVEGMSGNSIAVLIVRTHSRVLMGILMPIALYISLNGNPQGYFNSVHSFSPSLLGQSVSVLYPMWKPYVEGLRCVQRALCINDRVELLVSV